MSDETGMKVLLIVLVITAIMFGMQAGYMLTKNDIRNQLLQEGVIQYHQQTGKKVLVDDRYEFIWEAVK